MTKEEYIAWKNTRTAHSGSWEREDCEADVLIKEVAVDAATLWISKNVPHEARGLLQSLVVNHFGSVEIDAFLMSINAYPEWM